MQWLAELLSRRRRYDDLAISIQEHIAERADELMESGMQRAEAEQAARREFGNVGLIEERSHEAWQWLTLESILFDVRFALRQLVKSPGFTATAILTLALGIAVNATMFSMVSACLLPHLPGRDPQTGRCPEYSGFQLHSRSARYPAEQPDLYASAADPFGHGAIEIR